MAAALRSIMPILIFAACYAAVALAITNSYYQLMLTLVLVWACFGLSWNLLSGYTGLISFGHAAFFGIGAFTTALGQIYLDWSPWALIPVAMNIWRSVTGGVLACLMMLIGWLLGAPIKASGIPLALVVLFLGIIACNAIGTLAASFLVLFKRGEPVVMLFSLATAVLGGALFPISVLPEWIRWASYLIPHTYVISATRHLLIADAPADGLAVGWSIGILVVFSVVLLAAGVWVFDRSLKLARRLGILSI